MPVLADNVPEALRQLPRWLSWSWLRNPKKDEGVGGWDKPPLSTATGRNAKSNDPTTWSSFDAALRAHQRGDFDGIGVVLGDLADGRTLAGLDLDGKRDPTTGVLTATADHYLARLNTYTEISPSWCGTKSFCYGRLPRGGRHDAARGVEMYDGGRYFTVTGHRLDRFPADVMDRGEELRELHQLVFGGGEAVARAGGLSERELALAALKGLSARRAFGYHDWLGVGMALYSVEPSDQMCQAWDEWSQNCPEKYAPGVCAAKWATFDRHGLTLGSLLYWAGQDGWRIPAGKGKAGRGARPAAAGAAPAPEAGGDGGGSAAPSGYQIILAHFRQHYEPTFRRANVIYSARLGRLVTRTEACDAPGIELVRRLEKAADAPVDRRGVDTNRIPKFFREWAPSAYYDLRSSLPEEEGAAELCDLAREEFRAKVAGALLTMAAITYTYHASGGEERQEVQRRPLLEWCKMFAKQGQWETVRGYRLWCRCDGSPARLQVALRAELFRQIHCSELSALSHRRFSDLCRLYEVGRPGKVRGGDQRAVHLLPGYLDGLLAGPEDALPDGRTDEDTGAGAREDPASLRPSGPEVVGDNGVVQDVDPGRTEENTRVRPGVTSGGTRT
jgi:hypothetical protein